MNIDSSNKWKRLRSSTSETNNSFVKSVTEKVSGLLPARITKWFSSPKSANINGSAMPADATDSSTDDEDVPVTTQPPAKRMRFNSPVETSQVNPVDPTWVSDTLDIKEPSSVPYSSIQSPPTRSTFRHEADFISTPVRSPNESLVDNNDQDSNVFRVHPSVSSKAQSVAKKRESIFKTTNIMDTNRVLPTLNPIHDPKRPCFKPSLLSSSFYSGRTTYGGASSSFMNQANIKQKKVAHVRKSKANDTTAMSYSTKQIMDLLENYSSPLTEARRLPQYVKSPNTSKLNISTDTSLQINKPEYKSQELHVPDISSVLRFKQRSRLMVTTSVARQLIASHSSTIGFNPYPTSAGSLCLNQRNKDEQELDTPISIRQYKLRAKRTGQNRGVDKLNERAPSVNLPNAVLEIQPDNLPNFSFKATPTALSTTLAPSTAIATSTPIIPAGEPRTTNWSGKINNSSNKAINFKFSKPDPVVCDLSETSKALPNFTFDNPEREGKTKVPPTSHLIDDHEKVIILPNVKKDMILTNMLKEWKCSDCLVSNKSEIENCLCCGGKRPSVLVDKPMTINFNCSVCNIADAQAHIVKSVPCKKTKMKEADASPVKHIEGAKWKCNVCWVSNEETVDKCVCCRSINSKKSASPQSNSETVWKCANCWISNKASLEKCAACGGAKTTAKDKNAAGESSQLTGIVLDKRTLFPPVKETDEIFTNIVSSQKSDKWECSSCLVKNDNDKFLCLCCGMERENSKKAVEKNKIQFNFNTNIGTQFKFGIFNNEPQEPDMDNVMEEESLPEVPKIVESATNNRFLPKISTFSVKNFGDKVDFSKGRAEESPKVDYKFNSPKHTSPSLPSITIQVASPGDSNIGNEKPQEVPKIDFGSQSDQNHQNPLLGFCTPPKASNTSKPIPFSGSSSSAENNEKPMSYLTVPPVTTTSPYSPPTQSTFRFSASKLNPSGNLFTSPVSSPAVTTMPFGMPSQTLPTTTAPSVVSIFQKPEKQSNTLLLFSKKDDTPSTVQLFQKTEPILTTAQPTAVSAKPVFSFGPNVQSNAPAPTEKPKFNFVFGGNTTESSTIFQPPTFGTISDNNAGSNKFTLTSGKTLGGSNAPFGNPLSGNGLSSGSTLTGSTIPATNPLGGSTDATANPISGGNGLPTNNPLSAVFGSPGQKENMWSQNHTSNNMFVPNTTVSSIQKPAPFAFGTSSPFNANNPTPSFGNNTQPTPNVFGMPSQTTGTQPASFPTPAQNQTAPSLFGNPTPANNPAPSLSMFGASNAGATPTFGPPVPSIPSFEAPSLASPPASAFNFGAPPTTNVIGFGQQQQPQQPQQQPQQPQPPQPGVYSFGGSPAGAPQVQFNMGAAPNTAMRRMRKAVRRNPQR